MNDVRISSIKKCLPKQAVPSLVDTLPKFWMLKCVYHEKTQWIQESTQNGNIELSSQHHLITGTMDSAHQWKTTQVL